MTDVSWLVHNAWLVPALPLLSAPLIAMFGRRMPWHGAEIGIGAILTSLAIAVGIAWDTFTTVSSAPYERAFSWSPLGGGFVLELGMLIDGLTAMMFLLVTVVSTMVQIYSREYMHGERRFTYYYAMLSLFTFSMLFLVISNNTLQAVVGWELVGLCSFLLIGFYWEEKSNQDAANKAFLTTKFGDVGLIVGVIVLSAGMFGLTDTPFNFLETIDAAVAGQLSNTTIVLGMLLIFLGCISKSGQMPLHVWLPDAMAGPTPVSALIHAATMVTAGVFLLARLFPVLAQSATVMAVIAIVGVITLFFGGLLALVQDDIKKILAYSTISQLGYMVAAIGVGGYTASIFHLFTHGFFKALLFLGAGSLIHAVHSNNISAMGGLRRYMPHTFWTFTVGSLALAGFPLTAGFFSKDEILVAGDLWAVNGFATGTLVYWVGIAAAFVTTFYMARAWFLIFFGEHRGAPHDDAHGHGGSHAAAHDDHAQDDHAAHAAMDDHAHDGHPQGDHGHATPHESGRQMLVPLMVLAVLSLTAGLIGSPFVQEKPNFESWTSTPVIEAAKYPFLAEYATAGAGIVAAAAEPSAKILHGPPTWHLDLLLIVLVVFSSAVGLAWRFYGRGLPETDPTMRMGGFSRLLVNKYGFDDLGYRYVVVPVRDRMSAWATKVSNDVIDGAVAGVGSATMRIAATTYASVDQRIIDGGVNGAAFSAAWWSARLRRIQSGDVQRYAGALVAGVIILVLAFVAVR
jgi:NADH-quinone oxidoreductase subunit L